MEHPSLHSYLEACFVSSETVTTQMIIDAKKAYRSQYLKAYYKTYSEDKKQISFRVSRKQYRDITEKSKNKNLKVGAYIKTLVLTNKRLQDDTAIQYLVLQAIDILEEAIYEEEEVLNSKELLSLLKKLKSQLQ